MAIGPAVYVIGTTRRVKIGWAVNPVLRLKSFQMGSPVKLTLFFVLRVPSNTGARTLEARVHRALADQRAHGEWFKVSADEAIGAIILGMQELGYPGAATYRLPPRPSIRVVMADGSETVPVPVADCA